MIPVDIAHFKPHIQNIEDTLSIIKHLCSETRVVEIESECHYSLQPLSAQLQDMNKEFSAISHLIDNRSKRSAWVGGIGTILKQIFGSLDENDGIKYETAITSLQQDEKQLASLMKQNILVTKSTLRYYNDTLYKIRENEDNLDVAIDKLSLNIKTIDEKTNGLQILANTNEILNILEASILTLSFQLKDVTNAILFSSQNILHPAIMTPKQLHKELADSYRHLSSDLELPIVLDINSIHIILSISNLVCYYINNKIVFVLQVPLVNTKEYVLYHNIALPTPYNLKEPDSFTLIIPDNRYIAMTIDKSHYCVFDDLKICKRVSPGNLICDIENVYSTEAKPTCESELLAKVISKKPYQCKDKIILGKIDTWKPLLNNNWIFVQSDPQKISIDCLGSKLFETNILGTGILHIPKDCIGYCKSTTLIPKYNVLNFSSPINHFPEFSLINDTCCNLAKLTDVKNNVSPVHLHNIDLDDFHSDNKNEFKTILNDLEKIESRKQPHIVEYGTHYSALVIIMFILIILFLSCLVIKKFCKSTSNRPFQFKFNINKSLEKTVPKNIEITDGQDPEIELSNTVAPLRTRI